MVTTFLNWESIVFLMTYDNYDGYKRQPINCSPSQAASTVGAAPPNGKTTIPSRRLDSGYHNQVLGNTWQENIKYY